MKYWTPETELLAGKYLWMAADALSRSLVEADAAQRGMTPQNLARLHRVPGPPALYARAREKNHLQRGCRHGRHPAGGQHGFEHAYTDPAAVTQMLQPIIGDVAKCVRHALVKSLSLGRRYEEALLSPELDEARPLLPPIRILRGQIRVSDPALASDQIDDSVELVWRLEEQAVTRNAEGKLTTIRRVTATFVNVPPGMCVDVMSSGTRATGISSYEVSDVVVTKAQEPPDATSRPTAK